MPERPEVPDDIVRSVGAACLRLPEVVQEEAWVGTRWKVRTHTIAHVVAIADGWPPAYVEAAGTAGPAIVLTFRSAGVELEVLARAGHPFFKPVWFTDIVGMVLDDAVDWDEVAELVTESYRALAPQKLVARLDQAGA